MSLTINFGIGNDFSATIIKINNFPNEATQAIQNQLFIEGIELRQDMITSMRETPRSTKSYTYGRSKPHFSSKPGSPPAIDFGNLIRSFVVDETIDGVEVGVGLNISLTKGIKKGSLASYAENLEFGTSKMAARPFMQPATERQTAGLEDRLKKAILKDIK